MARTESSTHAARPPHSLGCRDLPYQKLVRNGQVAVMGRTCCAVTHTPQPLAACLVFLESNALLPDGKLPTNQWEEFLLGVAASKLDRDATTRRLRKLLKHPRNR